MVYDRKSNNENSDKLCFKWKVYDKSCNSWIDKKCERQIHLFQHGILYAIKGRHDLCRLLLLRLNLQSRKLFLFKCGHLCFISDLPYLLKGISRLLTTHADSFNESFIGDELALTETKAGLILSDFDKALVTVNCFD